MVVIVSFINSHYLKLNKVRKFEILYPDPLIHNVVRSVQARVDLMSDIIWGDIEFHVSKLYIKYFYIS